MTMQMWLRAGCFTLMTRCGHVRSDISAKGLSFQRKRKMLLTQGPSNWKCQIAISIKGSYDDGQVVGQNLHLRGTGWKSISAWKFLVSLLVSRPLSVLWKNEEQSQHSIHTASQAPTACAHCSKNAHVVYPGCQHE